MTPHKPLLRRSILSFMALMAISVGITGQIFAEAYSHQAKVVGNDISVADWNAIGSTLHGIDNNGSSNWGFGTAAGAATISTVGAIISGAGITISTGDLTVGAIDLSAVGTDVITSGASLAGYFNGTSGLTAVNVQTALDEIAAGGVLPSNGTMNDTLRWSGTAWSTSSVLTNDGTDVVISGITTVTGGFKDANVTTAIAFGDASNTSLDIGSSIVGAINAVHTNTLTNTTAINAVKTELDTTQTGAGLAADGTMVAWSGTNYLDAAADLKAGITALDTAVGNLSDGLQLTDSNTVAGNTCLVGEVGTIEYTDNGTMGEFIGCAQTGTGIYTWVRLSIYTQ